MQWEPCDRSNCRTDCEGVWGDWEACSVPCGSGGVQRRVYSVTQPAGRGGAEDTCEAQNGEEQTQEGCNSDLICPVDCEGGFGAWSECSAVCGGERFFINFPL